MSSGHQKPLCSSEAWVSFLASLTVSNDSVSNGRGRIVLSGILQSFHLSSAFTGTTVIEDYRWDGCICF